MKWYKMDCDAQENLDMRKLVDEWGWDWYGRYYAILGKIGMLITEKRQTFALQTNDGRPFSVKLLSDDLSTTVERLTNFCNFLADNQLIDKKSWYKKGLIYSPKLRERCDEYTDKLLRKSRQHPAQEVEEEVEVDKEEEQKKSKKRPASIDDVVAYFSELGDATEAQVWWDFFSANGFKVGKAKAPMADWKATCRTWLRNKTKWGNDATGNGPINGQGGRVRPIITDAELRKSVMPPRPS